MIGKVRTIIPDNSHGTGSFSRRDFLTLRGFPSATEPSKSLYKPASENKERETDITTRMREIAQRELDVDFSGKFVCGFWNHRITGASEKDFYDTESDVLCGELGSYSNLFSSVANNDVIENGQPVKRNEQSVDFHRTRLINMGHGSTEREKERSREIITGMLERGKIICATDGFASSEVVKGTVYSGLPNLANMTLATGLLLLAAAGTKATSGVENVSRRRFLRTMLVVGTLASYKGITGSSLPDNPDALNSRHPFLEDLPKYQIKLEEMAQELGIIPKAFFSESDYVINVRNKIMALTTWSLMDQLSVNGKLDKNFYFFGGFLHGVAQDELLKGPHVLQEELKQDIERILSTDNLLAWRKEFIDLVASLDTETSPDGKLAEPEIIARNANKSLSNLLAYINYSMFITPMVLSGDRDTITNAVRPEIIDARVDNARRLFLQALESKIHKLSENNVGTDYIEDEISLIVALLQARAQIDKNNRRMYESKRSVLNTEGNLDLSEEDTAVNIPDFLKRLKDADPTSVLPYATLGSSLEFYRNSNVSNAVPIGKISINGMELVVHREINYTDETSGETSTDTCAYSDYIYDIDGKPIYINHGFYTLYKVLDSLDAVAELNEHPLIRSSFRIDFIPGGRVNPDGSTKYINSYGTAHADSERFGTLGSFRIGDRVYFDSDDYTNAPLGTSYLTI